jgi:hypothetical protein
MLKQPLEFPPLKTFTALDRTQQKYAGDLRNLLVDADTNVLLPGWLERTGKLAALLRQYDVEAPMKL